jgi:hypothetical protein
VSDPKVLTEGVRVKTKCIRKTSALIWGQSRDSGEPAFNLVSEPAFTVTWACAV